MHVLRSRRCGLHDARGSAEMKKSVIDWKICTEVPGSMVRTVMAPPERLANSIGAIVNTSTMLRVQDSTFKGVRVTVSSVFWGKWGGNFLGQD